MNRRPIFLALGLVFAVLVAGGAQAPAEAQPVTPAADSSSSAGWRYIVEPYLLVPSMSGQGGVAGLTADVNAGPGDIFDVFEAGGMLYLEMRDARWAISLDGMYMHLGANGSTRLGTVDVDLKQGGVMVAGYRRVKPWAEAMLGVQFNSIDMALRGSGSVAVDVGTHQDWADPYVGARLSLPRSDKWRFGCFGAVGGFGVGSSFAWQVFPQVGYRFNPLFELNGGYRAIGMNYESGSGAEQFKYDLTTFGPQVGARFHF